MINTPFKLKSLNRFILAGAIALSPQTSLAQAVGSSLEDFFTAALDYSPKLKISAERKSISEARSDAAFGQLKPQISAQATVTDNRRKSGGTLDEFDGERYSVQLRQVLFNWATFYRRSQADSELDQAEAEYYYELSSLLTEVADKYFEVLQAQGEVTSKSKELDAVKNQLSQIQGKFDRQLAQITDLLRAKASTASVEAELVQLQSNLDLAREGLRSVSGLMVGKLDDLTESASAPKASEGVAAWLSKAQSNNFQIKAKEHAIKASEAGIERTRGVLMPTASIVVQHQDSDVGFDNAPVRRNETTYVGVDITVPLYAGGSNLAGLREAKSLHSIAKSELQQIKLDTSELVRSAYLQFKSSEQTIRAAEVLVESTKATADAMQKGFELGTVTNVDVLNAIRDQYEAERRLQESRYDSIKAYLVLKREAGDLSAKDMVEVSAWFTSSDTVSYNESGALFTSSVFVFE